MLHKLATWKLSTTLISLVKLRKLMHLVNRQPEHMRNIFWPIYWQYVHNAAQTRGPTTLKNSDLYCKIVQIDAVNGSKLRNLMQSRNRRHEQIKATFVANRLAICAESWTSMRQEHRPNLRQKCHESDRIVIWLASVWFCYPGTPLTA